LAGAKATRAKIADQSEQRRDCIGISRPDEFDLEGQDARGGWKVGRLVGAIVAHQFEADELRSLPRTREEINDIGR
jgi:hypothetical protein